MTPKVEENKEFAQWLGVWIARTRQGLDRIEDLPYQPTTAEEQGAPTSADGHPKSGVPLNRACDLAKRFRDQPHSAPARLISHLVGTTSSLE